MDFTSSMHEDYAAAGGGPADLPPDATLRPGFYLGMPMGGPGWMSPGGAVALVGAVAGIAACVLAASACLAALFGYAGYAGYVLLGR